MTEQPIKYCVLEVPEDEIENIFPQFSAAQKFLDDAFKDDGTVLVHGNAGISRCATFVIAYIMQSFDISFAEALYHVQYRRRCVNPNPFMKDQLKRLEKYLEALKHFPALSRKRPRDPSCDVAMDMT